MIEFSIIIPHYNSLEKLKKLLDSIPNMENIQVIVVDDNSDKKNNPLGLLISDYKNVTFLKNDRGKKGAGTCRNIGLSNAKGEWIIFADSDDFFLEGFYQVIQKYAKSKDEIIFFTPTSIELDTGNISDRHIECEKIIENYLKTKNIESELCLRYHFEVPWTKMIRKNFIEKYNINFDEVIASNDVMFSTKVGYNMKRFSATVEKIYCVTRSKGTLTMNMNKNIYYSRLSVFINKYNFLKERLSPLEISALKIDGKWIFLNAFKYRLSIKEILKVYTQLKASSIKILEPSSLNPIHVAKKMKYYLVKYKEQKKYFSH